MRLLGLRFGPTHESDLVRVRDLEPSYDHVGSTLLDQPVPGVHRQEATRPLGHGAAVFASAIDALRSWRPQRSLRMTVTPATAEPEIGQNVILGLGIGPVRLQVPDRVVALIDEPPRWGYAYGTLPGHAEKGEELFLVEMTAGGDVTLTIRTDSEPSDALRPLAPVLRRIQRAALERYLGAVASAITSDP